MGKSQPLSGSATLGEARASRGAALSAAAAHNDVGLLRTFLASGVHPDEPCPCCDGTALGTAVQYGALEAAETLLRSGASVPDYIYDHLGGLPRPTRRAIRALLRRFATDG